MVNDPDSTGNEGRPADPLLFAALEHCTKWVEFRTSHQVQAFNGFLVASGFLAAGYSASRGAGLGSVAITIAVIGVLLTLGFAYNALQLAKFVDVGEDALQVLEAQVSDLLNCPPVRLVQRAKGRSGALSRKRSAVLGCVLVILGWVGAGILAAVSL